MDKVVPRNLLDKVLSGWVEKEGSWECTLGQKLVVDRGMSS